MASVFTSSDLSMILEAAKAYIGIIVPVAIGLLAVILSVGFIPTVIERFRYGGSGFDGGGGYDTDYWSADDIAIFEAYDRGEIDSYVIDEDGVRPL